jgi:hypothetical protein
MIHVFYIIWKHAQNIYNFRTGTILSSKSCTLALGPTQFRNQWVPWIFPRGKLSGHGVDHSLHVVPSLRMSGAILPLPHMPSWHEQGQLYLYFIY